MDGWSAGEDDAGLDTIKASKLWKKIKQKQKKQRLNRLEEAVSKLKQVASNLESKVSTLESKDTVLNKLCEDKKEGRGCILGFIAI